MEKRYLTYAEQISFLREKNLIISDEAKAKETLRRYGYYALITGYKDLLKNPTTGKYADGTTLEDIVALYRFDEQLRELTFRYLLHIERQLRSSLSYSFCAVFGDDQNAYLDRNSFDISRAKKAQQVDRLIGQFLMPPITTPTKYAYLEHYKTQHHNVPLWVMFQTLSFGNISKFYEVSVSRVRSAVSRDYDGISEEQLRQILEVLTDFRNVCAHNERLFNHRCAKHDIPDLPLHQRLRIPQKGQQYLCGKRDYFAVIVAFAYLLPKDEYIEYLEFLFELLDRAGSEIKKVSNRELRRVMGIPETLVRETDLE